MNGEPSQSQANMLVRVLQGKRLKATVTIHLPNGQKIEFQSDTTPLIEFHTEDRSMWLMQTSPVESYGKSPIMRWPEGAIMLVEKNVE